MTTEYIRLGIIGAGDNTRKMHLPNLQSIGGVDVRGVVNRSYNSSKQVADDFGIPRVYRDWREAIDDEETDAILIGTWPYMHCRTTVAALEAGKHVLCEARMAMNAAEARLMYETHMNNPDIIAQLVPAPFTFKCDNTIIRLLSQGAIGELLAVEIRGDGKFIEPTAPLQWRQILEYSGYNALWMGVIYESVARWIGHARNVMARGQVFVKTRRNADGNLQSVRIPDHIDIISEMECGAQATMKFSAVTGHSGPLEVYLYGTEGTLKYSGERLFLGRREDPGLSEIEIPADEQSSWRVEQEFVNAIRGEEEVRLTTFSEGLRYMEFTEAVALSMQNQQVVHLPLM